MHSESPYIRAVGLAHPETGFSQSEIAALLNVSGAKSERFFKHDHVENRFLVLSKSFKEESTAELQDKFKTTAVKLITEAVSKALKQAETSIKEIDYICCVTSTGFVVPGLSALIMAPLGLNNNCKRVDIVGMGCNAGLNGLNTVVNWAKANPGKKALLICSEICSSIYHLDESENTALVNSLFGDGVAVALIDSTAHEEAYGRIIDSESFLIPNSLDSLRFDFDSITQKYKFFVGKETPKKLASYIGHPLQELLMRAGITKDQVSHWIVHTGGASILDAIESELHLKKSDLRNTRSVLKNYGNVSSGSFLFSYQELLNERSIKACDYGVMITMGPGLTIEMALVKWSQK